MLEQEQGAVLPEEPLADGEPAQSQEATPSPESGAQDADSKPEQQPGRVEKRISQLTWQKHEIERRLNGEIVARQQAEQRLAALEQQRLQDVHRAQMPRIEQYPDQQAFQQAVYAHNQTFLAEQQRAAQESAQRQHQIAVAQQLEAHVNARVAEGRQQYPDFEEVVANPQLPSLARQNPVLYAAVMDHELAPAILYHLGKNPSEAHRIVSLPPSRAVMEVGRIVAKLAPAAGRSTPSNAPAPPAQVASRSSGGDNTPRDNDSIDTWLKKRNAQLKARGR